MNTFNNVDEVCRTCMNAPSETIQLVHLDTTESTFMSTTIRQKLEAFAPELDLTIVFSSFICTSCVNAIEFIYGFKKTCLETEEFVQNYLRLSLEEQDHKGNFLQIADVQSLSSEPYSEGSQNGFPPKLPYIKSEPADPTPMELNQSSIQNVNPHLQIVDFDSVLFNTDDNININRDDNHEVIKDKVDVNRGNTDEIMKATADLLCNEVVKDHDKVMKDNGEVIKDKVEMHSDNNAQTMKEKVSDNNCEKMKDKLDINKDNDEVAEDKMDEANNIDDMLMDDISEDFNNDACSDLSEETSTDTNLEHLDKNHYQHSYTMLDTYDTLLQKRTILYKCNDCSYTVTYKSTFDIHMKTHRMENTYQCEDCGFKSTLKPILISHAKGHAKSESYKDFNFASALVSRISIYRGRHKSDKLFFCINCDFVAHNLNDFKTHLGSHK